VSKALDKLLVGRGGTGFSVLFDPLKEF